MRERVPAPAVPASTLPPVAACLREPPTRINDQNPSRIRVLVFIGKPARHKKALPHRVE